ncbi:decapping endonuclease targeting mRNA [Pyricularia oryzae]|uniref:Decapping nuclease n=2 Tax=Pyricularia TaxID=48558 RepID=A0ABQ8NRW8_PYRGI|nr:rai-1 [Pyricularia oryzae 70-15]KAH8846026.1 decapping endonuclease targeting mRNA [Pyricularia oryzae]KAI6301202.1 decapping endonuclease targeting mRNA [Pyricularia grisea]EHA47524.1 rai-1 [Pyricularia oryzae 70-15]KAH9432470.1 decapping endonuclease targeting mRNA [Pyricularia oryzae]KAI6257437.1 decapping endonuclease targeting mRNA [Pyricularia oryzae]
MSAHVTFQVQPISKFAGPSEPVRRPKEFACFSYDADHKFRLDDSSMKWYYPPRLGADLSEGFESFDKLDEGASAEHIDSLLQTIIAHEQRIGKKIDAHVVTWRGIVTKLMASPYEDRDGFDLNATLYQDCVFIEEDYASRMESKKAQDSEPWKSPIPREVMTFWGYKFETLSTIPKPWGETSRDYIEGRELEPTNNKEQYCSVVRTGIGKTILCIGGEVDAIWDSKPSTPGPINWVELKTSAEVRNDRDAANFERKLLKWWIQSFLLGVPKIVVGFRTRDGHLTRVDEMETNVIPANVQQRGRSWNGDTCINFCSAVLDWIRSTMDDDGVWRIRRRARSSVIEMFKIEETGHGRVLTDDFINWRIKLSLGVEPQPGQ